MKRADQWLDDLPKRNAIYQGDLEELKEKYALIAKAKGFPYVDKGECARLPQVLTDVGYTGRWRPGPRVIDLHFLLPGTVIANFKIVNGKPKYPNEHGYHAALFQKFENGALMENGLPCAFSMIDQWVGKRGGVGARGVAVLTPVYIKAHPMTATPSNNASEFYVVVVP
jgi:hypothetical protein